MDTKRDIAEYATEKKYGPTDCLCDGTCELAFMIAGEVHHYRDVWEKIADLHYPECPVCIAAKKKLKSTLCMCGPLEKAMEPEECLRCHNLAELCKCGAKAQLV